MNEIRKYLTDDEHARFIDAAGQHERPEVKTFALTLVYSGARISEALALTAASVDIPDRAIVINTLKQQKWILDEDEQGKPKLDGNGQPIKKAVHDTDKFRRVNVPGFHIDALTMVHNLRRAQATKKRGKDKKLWKWGRSQASHHIADLMRRADIAGEHANAKGLRHSYCLKMLKETKNPRLVQRWMGHTNLNTTAIYMDLLGAEAGEAAESAWK